MELNQKKQLLLKELENGRGVEHILNIAFKILGNPLLMFDTSYNLLTYTKGITTDDQFWNEFVTNGTFSHESVIFFKEEHFIEAVANSEVVSLLKTDKLKYDRINAKLFDSDNIQIGNITVIACLKPFGADDMEIIETIAEIISTEIQNSKFYKKIDRVYQESLISDLIERHNKPKEIIASKVAQLDENLKPNLYVAVVDIAQDERTLTHLAYYRDLFRKIQSEYKYYIHLNNIVVIISTDKAILNVKKDLTHLNDFFEKYEIYAGISSSFQNLFKLDKYYKEAINALNYGLKTNKKQKIFVYDDFRTDYFLNSIKDTVDLKPIFIPVIFLIQEYDRENNAALLEVLYVYLLYGRNIQKTCHALRLTQEELCVQLKILENVFEIDWGNGNMLLNLFLSIKMLNNFSR